jgi:hypothetical protein
MKYLILALGVHVMDKSKIEVEKTPTTNYQ